MHAKDRAKLQLLIRERDSHWTKAMRDELFLRFCELEREIEAKHFVNFGKAQGLREESEND